MCDIALSLVFYVLLRPVHKNLALLAAFFGLVSTAVFAGAELFYFAASFILGGADYLKSFSPDQLNTLALLSLKYYAYGAGIFMAFYGTAWVIRGYLIYRSGYFPRALGALLVLAGLGFITRNFILVLAPAYASNIFLAPMFHWRSFTDDLAAHQGRRRGKMGRKSGAPINPIRRCRVGENTTILAIVNAAAEAYRGVIPDDCWHEPYMSMKQLEGDIAARVNFWGFEIDGELAGVMGIQQVRDVDLIRHAYVLPASQGRGIGSKLLVHLQSSTSRPILIGTWMDAEWAIRFYQRHGYELVSAAQKTALLKKYWTISERQIETSVVLANPEARSVPMK